MRKFRESKVQGSIGMFLPVYTTPPPAPIISTSDTPITPEEEEQFKIYLQQQEKMTLEKEWENFQEWEKAEDDKRQVIWEEIKFRETLFAIRRCHQQCVSTNHFWRPNLTSASEDQCASTCLRKANKIVGILRNRINKEYLP